MICGITAGRAKRCSDSIAGFDIVYLFPFVSYDRSQIILNTNIITTFPDTQIFKFEVLNANLSEEMSEDDGGTFYDQNLSFDLSKSTVEDNLELTKLMDKDYMAIVSDRNGIFRLLGTYNGLQTEVTKVTGGGMADFNGYKVTMEGKESLNSLFVSNLADAGFIIDEEYSCTPFMVSAEELSYNPVKYVYLYNHYTIQDVRNIANTGWGVADKSEYEALMLYYDSSGTYLSNTASTFLKDADTSKWSVPSNGENQSNLNLVGSGSRNASGAFANLLSVCRLWNNDTAVGQGVVSQTLANEAYFLTSVGADVWTVAFEEGYSIRLIKDTTTLSNGESSTYTGNDGKTYRTICIGTQEWLADNLVETLYRNLDSIPIVTNNITWAGLSTGARCSYNNDEANAI